MVSEFYFGVGNGSGRKALSRVGKRIGGIDVLISYAAKVRTPPRHARKIFVDSGGYSIMIAGKDYDDDLRKYLKFVRHVRADYFANRDYPCEPELLKKRGTTVLEHQKRTVINQFRIQALLERDFYDLKDRFVAVIQGWELDDYLRMIDYMKDFGLITKRMAIGSICRRHQDEQIRKIINAVRKELPWWVELHAFGVKFNVLRYKDVWDALTSVDSIAYQYAIFKDKAKAYEQKILIWLKKLEELKKMHEGQRRIDSYE